MLLDYHSFYGQEAPVPPAPSGGGAWLPKKKAVPRRSQATATVRATLPLLDVHLVVSAKPQPKTRARVKLTLPPLQASLSGDATLLLTLDAALPELQSVVTGARLTTAVDVVATLPAGELRGATQTTARAHVTAQLPPVEGAALTTLRLSDEDRDALTDDDELLMLGASLLLAENEEDDDA
jgi:hypothetical protein